MSANFKLAAAVIVRDEAELLARCLESLRDVVDEIHVHDTGSMDGSPEVAMRMGATVTAGLWTDHFAEARNAALVGWTADWVLSIDADELVVADVPRLRERLAELGDEADAVTIEIDNEQHDDVTFRAPRLFRPARTVWEGRIHERVTPLGAGPLLVADLPRDLIRLRHTGYATEERRRSKALRNMVLGRIALDDLAADSHADRGLVARTLLDLGRSCIGAGHKQDAVDTLEMLRDLFPNTRERLQGTDHLARLMLAEGMDEICLVLVEDLRRHGAESSYCDWLAAQALAQLGQVDEAARLLNNVGRIVDTSGRRHSPAALAELKDLVAELQRLASPVS